MTTDPHALSKAIYALECENITLRAVADSVFARNAMIQREKNLMKDIVHRDDALSAHVMAKSLVRLYAGKVKPYHDPDSKDKVDASRTRAVRSAVKLIEKGISYERLADSVEAYGKYMDRTNMTWEHRFNAGNFFGKRQAYLDFLPEAVEPVPDAEQAAKVEALLFGEGDGQ